MNRNMTAKCNLAGHLGEQNRLLPVLISVSLIVFSIMQNYALNLFNSIILVLEKNIAVKDFIFNIKFTTM